MARSLVKLIQAASLLLALVYQVSTAPTENGLPVYSNDCRLYENLCATYCVSEGPTYYSCETDSKRQYFTSLYCACNNALLDLSPIFGHRTILAEHDLDILQQCGVNTYTPPEPLKSPFIALANRRFSSDSFESSYVSGFSSDSDELVMDTAVTI